MNMMLVLLLIFLIFICLMHVMIQDQILLRKEEMMQISLQHRGIY